MNTTAPYKKNLCGKSLLSLPMVPRAGVLHVGVSSSATIQSLSAAFGLSEQHMLCTGSWMANAQRLSRPLELPFTDPQCGTVWLGHLIATWTYWSAN